MKKFGCCNVRKHRDIKDSDKYTTLDILLKFVSLDKMIITFSDPKDNLGRSVKGADYLSGYQGQNKSKEIQKVEVCHRRCQYEGIFKDYQGVL